MGEMSPSAPLKNAMDEVPSEGKIPLRGLMVKETMKGVGTKLTPKKDSKNSFDPKDRRAFDTSTKKDIKKDKRGRTPTLSSRQNHHERLSLDPSTTNSGLNDNRMSLNPANNTSNSEFKKAFQHKRTGSSFQKNDKNINNHNNKHLFYLFYTLNS